MRQPAAASSPLTLPLASGCLRSPSSAPAPSQRRCRRRASGAAASSHVTAGVWRTGFERTENRVRHERGGVDSGRPRSPQFRPSPAVHSGRPALSKPPRRAKHHHASGASAFQRQLSASQSYARSIPKSLIRLVNH